MNKQRRLFFFFSIFLALTTAISCLLLTGGCSHTEEAVPYNGPGVDRSRNSPENKLFVSLVFPDLFPASETGWEKDDKEENPYRPRKISIDDISERIEKYLALDGHKLPGGRIFHKNSELLMLLYNEEIYAYDLIGDCEAINKIMEEYKNLYYAEDLIVVKPWSATSIQEEAASYPMILIFPEDEGYEKLRKEKTIRTAYINVRDSNKCPEINPFFEKLTD